MTTRFLDEWLADRAYYRISLTTDRAAIGTDNPDQRIAEDLRDFTDTTLSLGLGPAVQHRLAGQLRHHSVEPVRARSTLFGITIPGYMVWVALVYAVIGTCLTHLVGRPLARAEFPPAAGGGGFPLQPGAGAREHGRHRAVSRRARGEGAAAASVRRGDRQLVRDHAADQAAEHAGRWLRPGGGDLPGRRRGAALFLRRDATGRPDADRRRVRPGARVAVVVRRCVRLAGQLARHRRTSGHVPRRHRRRARRRRA